MGNLDIGDITYLANYYSKIKILLFVEIWRSLQGVLTIKIVHMEILVISRLAISHCIDDLLFMATSRFTGNTSSSDRRSMGEAVPFHSCFLANMFPAKIL